MLQCNGTSLLSHAECDQILSNALSLNGKFQLLEYNLTALTGVRGYLGEYYDLTLRYKVLGHLDANENWQAAMKVDAIEQLRVFVKCVPRASAEPEKEAIFSKEVGLYRTLLKQLQRYAVERCLTRCFYARADLLVLEHLPDQGFALCNDNVDICLSDQALRQVLRSLAAMHAASITYETLQQLNIGQIHNSLLNEITVAPTIAWWTTGLRAILALAKLHPNYQSTTMQRRIALELLPRTAKVYEMVNSSKKYRNVLCHRDTWRGNVFFRNDNVIFVDFQTARYCPPIIDVIYVLFMNLDAASRRSKEVAFLQYYYEQLRNDLQQNNIDVAQHLSEAELYTSYGEFQLFGLLYKAIAMTILKVPRALTTNEYMQVERTATVLELMRNDREFRACMEGCIGEMLEYLFENGIEKVS